MLTRRTSVRIALALGAAAVGLLYAARAEGVVTADPMDEPAEGYVGTFNGSSCVAVGSFWFITAKHVAGIVGQYVQMRGSWYRVVEIQQHPTYDVQLLRVAEELPAYHHLAMGVGYGDPCVLGGWGATAGAPLVGNNGWDWSGPHRETWGANVIEGEGNLLTIRFDPPSSSTAVPHEAIFAVNDSGGGLFTYAADGSLELAGVAVSVTGWGAGTYGNAAFALNVDLFRNWMIPMVDPSQPLSSGVEAPRAGLGLPGLPEWSAGALVLALAGVKRRR